MLHVILAQPGWAVSDCAGARFLVYCPFPLGRGCPDRRKRDVLPRGVQLERPARRIGEESARSSDNAEPFGTAVLGRIRVPGVPNALAGLFRSLHQGKDSR